jgi:hypothetical protein
MYRFAIFESSCLGDCVAATSVYQRFFAILRREKNSEPIFYMLLRGGSPRRSIAVIDGVGTAHQNAIE